MITIEEVRNILKENNIFMGKQSDYLNSISIMIRCPYCGDSKKNTYKCHMQLKDRIYKGKRGIWFRCPRCSKGGHILELLKFLGIDFDEKKYKAKESLEFIKNFKQPDFFSIKKAFGVRDKRIETINLRRLINIVKSKEINNVTKRAIKYLIKERDYDRDFVKELFRKRVIGICDNFDVHFDKDLSPLYERILFFSYNKVLIQGRSINDYGKRYYIYRKNNEYSDIIYFDGIGPMIFLTEGPFDSMRISSFGYNSISLQGKNPGNLVESFKNFEKTRNLISKFRFIIFCFDIDVPYENLEKTCHVLWKSGIISNRQTVGYLKMYDTEYKDIDMVRDEDTFDEMVKSKISLFSPLDRVKNIFNNVLQR